MLFKELFLLNIKIFSALFLECGEELPELIKNDYVINEELNRIDDENLDEFIHYEIDKCYENSDLMTYANASSNTPTFSAYRKGDSDVNIIFNFVNYKNDTVNVLTNDEITNKMQEYSTELKEYWDTMSLGKININVDYITCIAPLSYNEYKALTKANYTTENNIFLDSLSNSKKDFAFDNFQVKINVFAGDAGGWNTFLWAHSYSSSGLIMLVESSMITSTLCHELGHTFGANDLYAYTGSQLFAVGGLDIMGDGHTYQPMNAYTRSKIGFLETSMYDDNLQTSIETITDEKQSEFTSLKLYPSYSKGKDKIIAYKFGEYTYQNRKEFFVVEYRINNYNSFYDPNNKTGIVVYRVNQTQKGNSNANKDNYSAEIVFMGNHNIDVSNRSYIDSCQIGKGNSIGSVSDSNYALSYTGGLGKANLFSGTNSKIVVEVCDLNDNFATINIKFPEKEILKDDSLSWDNTTFTFNCDTQYPKLNITNDKVTYSILSGEGFADGNYTLKIQFDYDSALYILDDNFKNYLTCEYKILPYKMTLKAKDYTTSYDKKDHRNELTYEIILGEFFYDDDYYLSYGLDVLDYSSNAGEYIIKLEAELEGYEFTLLDGKYLIKPIEIEAKINDASSLYNEKLSELSYDITSGLLLNGDSLDVNLTKESGNDVGDYAISGINNNKNYNVSFTNGIYTINKANIDATSYDTIVTYDGKYHFIDYIINTDDDFTILYGLDLNNITLNNYNQDDYKNVCYDKTCYIKISNKNYNDLILNSNLTINKAIIDASSFDTVITYDGNYHMVDYTVNIPDSYNIKYGYEKDNIIYDDYEIEIFKNATEINCYISIDAGSNYESKILSSKLVILPKKVIIRIDDIEEYEGYLTYNYSYHMDEIIDTNLFTITSDVKDEPGNYDIYGNDLSNNYEIEFINGTYKVLENTLYTIKYQLNGANNDSRNINSYTKLDNNKYYLYEPSKVGYSFTGWYDEDNNKIEYIDTSLNKNMTITARFSKNSRFSSCNETSFKDMVEQCILILIIVIKKKII